MPATHVSLGSSLSGRISLSLGTKLSQSKLLDMARLAWYRERMIDLTKLDFETWLDIKPPLGSPGVYALFQKDGTLFYVGQALDILERIKVHKKKGFWSTCKWLPEQDGHIRRRIEAALIALKYPLKNKAIMLSVEGTSGIAMEGCAGFFAMQGVRKGLKSTHDYGK